MKIMSGNHFWGAVVLPFAAGLIAFFSACTPIHVGGEIVLREDGSGSRKFALYIYDEDDGYGGGNARNYLKVHGDELKAAVEQKLKRALKDSSWLTVAVSQGYGAMSHAEIVTLSFDFKDFSEYTDRMTRLAKFGKIRLPEGSEFKAPKLKKAPNNQLLFTESGKTQLWTVRPLFLAIFDDPNLFDITSKGANTSHSAEELRDMLAIEAVPFKATLGSNAPKLFLSGADINETFPNGEV